MLGRSWISERYETATGVAWNVGDVTVSSLASKGTLTNNKGVSNFVIVEAAERKAGPGHEETIKDWCKVGGALRGLPRCVIIPVSSYYVLVLQASGG